ncbi:MAG TPA: alkyl hydroperoxide reductase, partial [Chloroflexota bacterium]
MRKLERKFPNEMVVVGVHSPKFTAERETENVRKACLRLGLDHPVVSDPTMRMWSEYAVQAWPTLMFVDPTGKVVGKSEGEIQADEFEPVLASMIQEYDARGVLSRTPIEFAPEEEPATPLLFPGKALGDAASGRLFIADSGHNRIVVAGTDGHTGMVIGTGEPGLRDGGPDEAAFHLPQGLAVDGDVLYVADTWNHAVRRVEVATGRVTTIAGTGQLGRRVKDGPGLMTDLRSPWGLVFQGGTLYVAMAGTHNIWTLDPGTGELAKYSGTGREALTDGPLYRATYAQPSGMSADGRVIYVADSETSAVRTVDLPGAGDQVRTLAGQGLFVFGDVDGRGSDIRLQHALDVAF